MVSPRRRIRRTPQISISRRRAISRARTAERIRQERAIAEARRKEAQEIKRKIAEQKREAEARARVKVGGQSFSRGAIERALRYIDATSAGKVGNYLLVGRPEAARAVEAMRRFGFRDFSGFNIRQALAGGTQLGLASKEAGFRSVKEFTKATKMAFGEVRLPKQFIAKLEASMQRAVQKAGGAIPISKNAKAAIERIAKTGNAQDRRNAQKLLQTIRFRGQVFSFVKPTAEISPGAAIAIQRRVEEGLKAQRLVDQGATMTKDRFDKIKEGKEAQKLLSKSKVIELKKKEEKMQ